jgi:hypothetical protein
MTLPARHIPRSRPRLTVVRGTSAPVVRDATSDWRRVASAVLTSTHELTGYMLEQRWGRVQEAMSERRELLEWLARLPLDTEGRRCLLALTQAADEAEAAITAMMGGKPGCE